ncbi:pimeloyl-ACP methyl ester esterase BioH [Endothiovibrio diazotrophicus]
MSNRKLFIETFGEGSDLVMLHGWGMHSGLLRESAERLAATCRVTLVDLPGHGRSAPPADESAFELGRLAEELLEALPDGAVWLGWSLGGMVAMAAAALAPERVGGLILVGATPRFVQDRGWPHAMDPKVLDAFWEDLQRSYKATLTRFLALQTRGSDNGQEALRRMRARLFEHGEPDHAALRGGLRILREADLRGALAHIDCPTLVLLGDRDTLVPTAAGEALVAALPHARLEVMAGAGHAPFLSHSESFVEQVAALFA